MTLADHQKRLEAAIQGLARARSRMENALAFAKYDNGRTMVEAAIGQLQAAATEVLCRWDDVEEAKGREKRLAQDVVRALAGGLR